MIYAKPRSGVAGPSLAASRGSSSWAKGALAKEGLAGFKGLGVRSLEKGRRIAFKSLGFRS